MAKLRVESLLKEGRKVMVILRGPPGSGKSTIAREIQFEGVVLSTDEFFVKPNGQFQYDFTKIGDAHQWNQQRAKESCEVGRNPIVIDNTNSQAWEMKYYVALADEHMYHIEIMEPSTQWKYKPKELAKRNTHGVTLETIVRMLDRYERNITPASILATLPKRPNTAKAPVKIPTDDKADSAAEPPPTGKK
ncbi:hypothetical protein CAPTEDRAFT_117145 [Capitella teleta]|uniref:NEDD4-binding protein 2-like 1 n=1 Tax=Capitella teleta TaxID=283909 RepID=R7UKH3_CAPTE|nr:hypothetical protein CAPTEDRAFT_117145 [Capitella teleta]|eukprot:ELU04303.1 hypothetical protein CAPTEDRAFT_117145 [Capitella teleta]